MLKEETHKAGAAYSMTGALALLLQRREMRSTFSFCHRLDLSSMLD